MSYIDDFVKGGYWPLQHFERDYDLDLRYVRYACRIDTRDEDGFYTVEDRTAGDVLGAVLWPAAQGTTQGAPVQASSTQTAKFGRASSVSSAYNPNTFKLNVSSAKVGPQPGANVANPSESTPAPADRDLPGWAFGWPARVMLSGAEVSGYTVSKADQAAENNRETKGYWMRPVGDDMGEPADGFSVMQVNVPRTVSGFPTGWTGIVHAAADPHAQIPTWHPDFLGVVTSPLTPDSKFPMDFDPLTSTRVYGAAAADAISAGFGGALGNNYKDAPTAPLHSLIRTLRMSSNANFDTDSALVLYSPIVAFADPTVQGAYLKSVLTAGAGLDDIHHQFESIDGVPVNSAHVKTGAPFFDSRDFDGPLDFEAREMDASNEGPVRFKTRLHWKSGKWVWSTGLPIYKQEEEDEPPPKKKKKKPKKPKPKPPYPGGGEPPPETSDWEEDPTLWGPFWGEPQYLASLSGTDDVPFDPDPVRQRKHHRHATVGSPHEWHVPGIAFRPTPVVGGDRHALDTRYNYSLTPAQVAEFQTRPVTARLEAFGHEDGTGRWDQSCNNHALARYQDAESVSGGIVITPPEIGIEHIAGALSDAGLWKSDTYMVALAGDTASSTDVWFATGTPDVLTGGVNTGFRWGGYSDGVLAFDSLDAAGTGTELLRMSSTTLAMASGKIFNGSTARVQISQGANDSRSETPLAGELYASNDKNVLRLTTET